MNDPLAITPADYIEKFGEDFVCVKAREWLLDNGFRSMREAWDACHRIDWMLMLSTKIDIVTDAQYRELALRCARDVEHMCGGDPRVKKCNDVNERHQRGEATVAELAAAGAAAWAAGAAGAAAARAAGDAAWAAWAAERAAAGAEKQKLYADWLREIVNGGVING